MAKRTDDSFLLNSFLDININELDREWIEHPRKVYKFIKEYEQTKIRLLEDQAELDVIVAQLSKIIRKNPKKYGLDPQKPTETAIFKTVILKRKYQDGLKVVQKTEYELGLLKAAVKTCDHMKSALERLVSLHGQNYFSTPQPIDKTSHKTVDDIKKKAARARTKRKKRNKE